MSSQAAQSSTDAADSPESAVGPDLLSTHETVVLADQLALFFERFGFRRNLGRLWATLFLAAEPLSQQQLGERLSLSAGLVSSGLKELDHFAMVTTVTTPGERRAYYRAETRLLRIVAAILDKREVPAVKTLHEAVRVARHAYARRSDAKHLPARLRAIEEAARLYSALARLVVLIAHLPEVAVSGAIQLVEALKLGDGRNLPVGGLARSSERRTPDSKDGHPIEVAGVLV
jgi:DNA-binding transcriptional regulator GbsR (MarR family)